MLLMSPQTTWLPVAKVRKKAGLICFGNADQRLDAFFVSVRATANDLPCDEERWVGMVVAREQLRGEVCKLSGGWRLVFHYLDDFLGQVIRYVKALRAEVEEIREELAELRM